MLNCQVLFTILPQRRDYRAAIYKIRYTGVMLKLSESLMGQPVMSLRTGQQVATTTQPIINPNNLKIEGFYCIEKLQHKELVLLYQDIRDIIPHGFVINELEVLAEPADLVRLKDILNLNFELLHKPVVTLGKRRLGKVTDFATELETMYVQKLYVTQGLKGLTRGNLGIERNQINEITDKKIIVTDPLDGGAIRAGAIA